MHRASLAAAMRGYRRFRVKNCLKFMLIAATIGMSLPAALAAAPQVSIDSGALLGVEQGELNAYLGIPYAAPPVAALRWMPPQQPQPWNSVLEATRFGNSCTQNADLGVFGQAGGTEDCLYLNVYVSRKAARSKEKLPVLFWIHGGSLWVGAGKDYDPGKLAVDGNAVVVTINYRLGLFGFFAHPALDREGHAFANYGLMDQRFALDWVQRNIAAFGGDPRNVTIFGESSGGSSVLSHIVSPGSAGKFQHAIAMSGATIILKYPAFGSANPLDYAEERGIEFAKAVGCEGDRAAACLRRLSAGEILAAQTPYLIKAIVDGSFLPVAPAEALRSGQFNHVTLINGNTRDEGTFFVGFPENESGIPMTATGYVTAIETLYGKPLADRVLREYPVERYNTPSEAYAAAVTASQFACPGRAVNRWVADKIPTYAYEFADRTAPSYLAPTTFPLGAAHTYELPYIFPGFHGGAGAPVKLNPIQSKLSDQMVKYWSEAGKATARESVWPRYSPAQDNYMSLTLPEARMTSHTFGDVHNCEFWDRTGLY